MTVSKKIEFMPADTSSYKILLNSNNLVIDDEFRKKINSQRKNTDFVWKPDENTEILIYKKE